MSHFAVDTPIFTVSLEYFRTRANVSVWFWNEIIITVVYLEFFSHYKSLST